MAPISIAISISISKKHIRNNILGAMEMVERLAYYGVRTVATLYTTRAVSEGGLGVTMATFGLLKGMDPSMVTEASLPVGEAFQKWVAFTGESPEALTRMMFDSHHIGMMWYVFAAVGVVSAAMIFAYGVWVRRLAEKES